MTAKKKPAAVATATAAAAAEVFKPGQQVTFHQGLCLLSADEYAHALAAAERKGTKVPERGSHAPRAAIVAEGPNKKGQYKLRMVDDGSELVTKPGELAGLFSA